MQTMHVLQSLYFLIEAAISCDVTENLKKYQANFYAKSNIFNLWKLVSSLLVIILIREPNFAQCTDQLV